MTMHTVVPCSDCDEKRQQLEDMNFRVLGCTPIAGRDGFCTIEFEPNGAAAAPAALVTSKAIAVGLTSTQAATAKAIVNVFETGAVLGDYGNVTVIAGDTGHLTFGRSQTTLGSGNLGELLQQYCAAHGAAFAARLTPYLPRFAARDFSLDQDEALHNLLRATADDLVMRDTQDQFFDAVYWQPAQRACANLGITTPLGAAVVYDSFVHGSWAPMRKRTSDALGGDPADKGERAWITAYVQQRRAWLATNARKDLQATVYRMDAFQRLLANDMWALTLPLVVRGCEISNASLAATPPGCYDGPAPGSRALALATPMLRGLDVRRIQLALSDRGFDVRADGVYGRASENLVKQLQAKQNQPVTGMLDPAAVVALIG
jgi:chitosanase